MCSTKSILFSIKSILFSIKSIISVAKRNLLFIVIFQIFQVILTTPSNLSETFQLMMFS